MPDYRMKVEVEFTIDVGLTDKPKFMEENDIAEYITRQVFKESFSRAHLLSIKTENILEIK